MEKRGTKRKPGKEIRILIIEHGYEEKRPRLSKCVIEDPTEYETRLLQAVTVFPNQSLDDPGNDDVANFFAKKAEPLCGFNSPRSAKLLATERDYEIHCIYATDEEISDPDIDAVHRFYKGCAVLGEPIKLTCGCSVAAREFPGLCDYWKSFDAKVGGVKN
jgi:hypothetical protein